MNCPTCQAVMRDFTSTTAAWERWWCANCGSLCGGPGEVYLPRLVVLVRDAEPMAVRQIDGFRNGYHVPEYHWRAIVNAAGIREG